MCSRVKRCTFINRKYQFNGALLKTVLDGVIQSYPQIEFTYQIGELQNPIGIRLKSASTLSFSDHEESQVSSFTLCGCEFIEFKKHQAKHRADGAPDGIRFYDMRFKLNVGMSLELTEVPSTTNLNLSDISGFTFDQVTEEFQLVQSIYTNHALDVLRIKSAQLLTL